MILCVWSQARASRNDRCGDPTHAERPLPGRAGVRFDGGATALTLEELRSRRIDVIAVAGRHGASHLRVFGSVARQAADNASDIDLLVDLEPGRTLLDLVALERDLTALLGRRIDIGTRLRPSLHRRVEREVVEL